MNSSGPLKIQHENQKRMPLILFCSDTFLKTLDKSNPFIAIKKFFKENWVCVNLETSLKTDTIKENNVSLCIDEKQLDSIPDSIRILSIVNNHVWDSGNPCKLVDALKQRGKFVVGPNNPSHAEILIEGIRVEFFSAYFSIPRLRLSYNGAKADKLERMVRESNSTHKIVNLHWGYEHTDTPAPFQRTLAHRLVDAGADIIIGHHPHVPQGYEIYKGKPIYYSLGNFNFWQFDTEPSENNLWGFMVSYDLETGKTQTMPYRINENYQPYRVSPEIEDELKHRFDRLSNDITHMDCAIWLKKEYDQWFKRELKVWKRVCRTNGSLKLWLKWAAWLCLPMQMKYYWHKIFS